MIIRILCVAAVLFLSACGPSKPRHPLVKALRGLGTEKLEALLDEGAEPDTVVDPESKRTILHAACDASRPDAVALLLKRGADANLTDAEGKTPWDVAIDRARYLSAYDQAVLANLLRAGYRPPEREFERNRTLLHWMAEEARETGLITLAVRELKLDVEARDEYGWTPLHVASHEGNPGACSDLLAAGADPNAETTRTLESYTQVDGIASVDYRMKKGSRPLDLHRYRSANRGRRSASAILAEAGATKNPAVSDNRLDY